MSQTIYCGRANNVPYGDLMDLINQSFGFVEPERQMQTLLPKCYREEYRPQDSNYVVIDESGVLAAVVGAYDHEMIVCGRRLACRGIGNVGVHPDHRSKGYMKIAMDKTLKDMVSDGVAMSTLAGRRQRYQYTGYEKAGSRYMFTISPQNISHVLNDRGLNYTVRTVTDPTDAVIDDIVALNKSQTVDTARPRDRYLDIANSWRSRLLAVAEGDRFVGYCIVEGANSLIEFQVVRNDDILDAIKAIYDFLGGGYKVGIPLHDIDYAAALEPFAEHVVMVTAMQFNIFNYRLVTEAFLALKLSYMELPDGELTFLIHGYASDERIRVAVKNGKPCVEYVSDSTPVDYEFSHLQATEFLFSPFSAERERACALARLWFPLPIYMYRTDEV